MDGKSYPNILVLKKIMSITNDEQLESLQRISEIVAVTLREMKKEARPGMSARDLDNFGGKILMDFGARPAPKLSYGFPGYTCISVNEEIAHGLPRSGKILKEGDLVNIDVSAELNGYWSDNGSSFILGHDRQKLQPLVDASRDILRLALDRLTDGVGISAFGQRIEQDASQRGFRVIKNLAGHGIGRKLHEAPDEILNCANPMNFQRFKAKQVVAIETFISTKSTQAVQLNDGWTLVGNRGGFVAQQEHTVLITEGKPVLLTSGNSVFE